VGVSKAMRMFERMTRHIHAVAALLLVLAMASGCASRSPALERLTPDAMMERGLREYEARRYTDAVRTLERLTFEHPTHPRHQEARYILADAYLKRKEYLTAAGEFVRLASDYPTGVYAAAARLGVCEAYYNLSPPVQLDQQYTQAAVEHCRALMLYFPQSEHAERAQAIAKEMEDKLAEKVFVGGEFYFRRKAYDPAIIYYEDVLEDYPGSAVAPRALLRIVQAYNEKGYREEAEAARERLLREYPHTAEARQAREISIAGGT
jgi:outer membrane protein assembly factor BamD